MVDEKKNTGKTLHENVDCRIIMTAQHSLGIDVGGNVKVCDPLDWHKMPERIEELEKSVSLLRDGLALHRSMVLAGETESDASEACFRLAMDSPE